MTASLLKGSPVSKLIFESLSKNIEQNIAKGMRPPHLEVILVGDDKPSLIYVGHKSRACNKIGMTANTSQLDDAISENELISHIEALNQNDKVDGILVQLPLPLHISTQTIIDTISIHKDVDGFHPFNLGRLALRHPCLRPCTPHGIITLLNYYKIPLRGKNVTVVGVSNIVGRPLVLEFLLQRATPTACHRYTKNLKEHIVNADIVVSATGVKDIINPDWFKSDAVVIDVGIHRMPDGSIRGDIDFQKVKDKVGFITPVPGGVGPMTVATLLTNTYEAYKKTNCLT
jgi:methylenetetrahydrofolate dehydrogenase (NADP+)/methenyltetrahydrofolate cyclohydrolase